MPSVHQRDETAIDLDGVFQHEIAIFDRLEEGDERSAQQAIQENGLSHGSTTEEGQ